MHHSGMHPALLLVSLALQGDPLVGRASVIDGDTLEMRGQRIRLWGIDAPEGRQTCTRDGEAYRCGTEAARYVDGLLVDKTVTCHPQGRPDRYERIVAKCYIDWPLDESYRPQYDEQGQEMTTYEQDIAAFIVMEGWAVDYPKYSSGRYELHQMYAQDYANGVWAGDFQMPWEWRRSRR